MGRLDREERELLSSVERGRWRPIRATAQALRRHATYARNALRKDSRINIRISQMDLEGIRAKALQEGIPYQTLISSILHKYVSGQMKAA
jgi:predicted DNA binding CopG/RHH family protein